MQGRERRETNHTHEKRWNSLLSLMRITSLHIPITNHVHSYVLLIQVSLYNFSFSLFLPNPPSSSIFLLIQDSYSNLLISRSILNTTNPSQLMFTHLLLNRCHSILLSNYLISNPVQPYMNLDLP